MLKHQDLKMFGLKLNNYDYFLRTWGGGGVVDRGSETQLQVGET